MREYSRYRYTLSPEVSKSLEKAGRASADVWGGASSVQTALTDGSGGSVSGQRASSCSSGGAGFGQGASTGGSGRSRRMLTPGKRGTSEQNEAFEALSVEIARVSQERRMTQSCREVAEDRIAARRGPEEAPALMSSADVKKRVLERMTEMQFKIPFPTDDGGLARYVERVNGEGKTYRATEVVSEKAFEQWLTEHPHFPLFPESNAKTRASACMPASGEWTPEAQQHARDVCVAPVDILCCYPEVSALATTPSRVHRL